MNSKKLVKKKSLITAVLFLLLCGLANTAAAKNAATMNAEKWQYEFTIYGWFPSLDGDLKYSIPPGSGGSASVDASDIIDSLNFVFMGAFEARLNKWSFGTDLIYMDLSNGKNKTFTIGQDPGVPVNAGIKLSLTSWVVTGVVGYDLVQTDRARMAVIGGVRYLNLDSDADLSISIEDLPDNPPPARLSASDTFWDGIVGIRGAFLLNEHWYLPYYADIGAGDSQLTWQLYAGIGYQFGWGDVKLGYRYLNYDQDDDKFVQDLALYGPLMGVGFRF